MLLSIVDQEKADVDGVQVRDLHGGIDAVVFNTCWSRRMTQNHNFCVVPNLF